jgi:hypothetical protein
MKTADEFYAEHNGGMTAEEATELGDHITPIHAVILMKDYASQSQGNKDLIIEKLKCLVNEYRRLIALSNSQEFFNIPSVNLLLSEIATLQSVTPDKAEGVILRDVLKRFLLFIDIGNDQNEVHNLTMDKIIDKYQKTRYGVTTYINGKLIGKNGKQICEWCGSENITDPISDTCSNGICHDCGSHW